MERNEEVGGRPPKRRPLSSVVPLTDMMVGKDGWPYLGYHCAESLATESLLKPFLQAKLGLRFGGYHKTT